jgi:hypothetical protein
MCGYNNGYSSAGCCPAGWRCRQTCYAASCLYDCLRP